MTIERPDIANYLPHKDAMLLLDRIIDYDLEKELLVSEVDIGITDLFYDRTLAGVPAWTGFEYMAQSIAALSGVHARTVLGAEPKIGFIMSIRNFETKVPAYSAGETVRTRVSQIFRDESVVAFDCSISVGDAIVTTAVVNAIEVESLSMLKEVAVE
jgi:predicted hotdog family 3-hydroxylacyl-ACP dehydratase